MREGLIEAAFAILVILVFLFSLRSTLVTAVSIPLSIFIALIGLWIGNYTLNLFTLGGLTIAIGRVVDDSIVVLENIYRHLSNGEEKRVAIPNAVREVAGAITASTLTTVSVFLPPYRLHRWYRWQLFKPFSVTQTLPTNTSLDVTNEAAKKVESVLEQSNNIKYYQVTIGSGGSGFSALFGSAGGSNRATFTVTPKDDADLNIVQQQVQDRLKSLTNVGTLKVASSGQGGFDTSSITVNVQASDDATLRQAPQQVQNAVSQVSNTKDVSSNLTDAAPLIDVKVDPQKAAKYGLSAAQVGQLVRQTYTGTTVTKITLNGKQQDVSLLVGSQATSVDALKDLPLAVPTGSIKLSDIAENKGPTQITHISGIRTATISTTATSQNTIAVSQNVQNKLKQMRLPDGASYSFGGVITNQSDAFSGLGLALVAAIVLVYLVMVATFHNLLQPLLLLVSIPFAATGFILLLLITRTPLGVPSLIGLLMLVGIVVTNAIFLLDLMHQYRLKGMDAYTAVIEGGRRRLRPTSWQQSQPSLP